MSFLKSVLAVILIMLPPVEPSLGLTGSAAHPRVLFLTRLSFALTSHSAKAPPGSNPRLKLEVSLAMHSDSTMGVRAGLWEGDDWHGTQEVWAGWCCPSQSAPNWAIQHIWLPAQPTTTTWP